MINHKHNHNVKEMNIWMHIKNVNQQVVLMYQIVNFVIKQINVKVVQQNIHYLKNVNQLMDVKNHNHKIIVYNVQKIKRNVNKDIVMYFQYMIMVYVNQHINNVNKKHQIVQCAQKKINVQFVNKDIN